MAVDIGNFIAQNSPRFNRAAVDRQHYGNALLQNQVQRLPQMNRAQDLAIQASELDLGNVQRQNAAGVLGRNFSIIANSPRPREAARAFLGSPDFQTAGKLAGLPVEQFTITDADTDDSIRQQAQAWADVLNGGGQQRRVQSTFVGKNGNQWIVTADGNTVDTGVPVSQFAQRPIETAAGIEAFDPGRGGTGGPISPNATAPALDQAAQNRKYSEALGSGRGQAVAEREAGAPQRAERARLQITNIDNVLSAVDGAVAKIDWNTTGFVGNATKNIAGTPAHDLQQQLLTIQANLGFDRLQQMRDSSPTGGALGQVAVQELNALQAAVAAIAQSQSDAQLRSNLQKVRTHYENWKRVVQQAQQQQGGLPDFSQMTDEQLQQIINGQ